MLAFIILYLNSSLFMHLCLPQTWP